jgi:hypothetical protein
VPLVPGVVPTKKQKNWCASVRKIRRTFRAATTTCPRLYHAATKPPCVCVCVRAQETEDVSRGYYDGDSDNGEEKYGMAGEMEDI